MFFFFFTSNIVNAQKHYLDTLPKKQFLNGISFQGKAIETAIGIYYSRNLWNGLGFRNYSNVKSAFLGTDKLLGFDRRAQHNHRLSLKRLLYFSMNLGYNPLIPFRKSEDILYDDFINQGYCTIGISGHVKNMGIGFYGGVVIRETKQDLYYSINTFARPYPEFKVMIGYYFGQKKV